jgi:hypothetical protein
VHTSSCPISRRRLLLAGTSALALAACGGGGDDSGGPQIQSFGADREWVYVGERVRLSASFKGNGRIEPGLGAVTSGAAVESGVQDRDFGFRLVVEVPGRPAISRTLQVGVRYRNRYGFAFTGFVASYHAAVSAPDGRVWLVGGARGEPAMSPAIDRFDPATGRFSRVGALRTGRTHHRAVRLADGRVLVCGGWVADGDARVVEIIDGQSGAASTTGPLNTPRTFHAALALPDGRVLVSGGLVDLDGQGRQVSDTAELWEPSTGRFRRVVQRMGVGRAAHSLSLLADGRVLIVGGHANPGESLSAEIFDPRVESFTPLAAIQAMRAQHAAHVDDQGRVLILGGETLDGNGNPMAVASVLRYEPASGNFAALPPLREPRSGAGTVLLPSGQVLLFGGLLASGQHSATAERYDPSAGGQGIAGLDSPRAGHGVMRLPDGRVLVAGGEDSDGNPVPSALIYE